MTSLKRNSNIELLRIVIMFMILLLHANFFTFKIPTDYSFTSFLRCFAEAFTLTPVNIFVLITGFFGTVFSVKKVLSLIFQVFFCVVPISIFLTSFGIIESDFRSIIRSFVFNEYWFINAYIGLLILTPILNVAVDHLSHRVYISSLLFFNVIAFLDAFWGVSGIQIGKGYSLIWFIFLYLLGRYVKCYQVSLSQKQLITLIVISCLCNSLIIFTFHSINYVNPFIVIQSISTLLLFTKFEIKSDVINWVAASTTMVYLVNLHPVLCGSMKHKLWFFYQNNSTFIFLLYTVLFCISIFVFAIFYDKLRIFIWKRIELAFSQKK